MNQDQDQKKILKDKNNNIQYIRGKLLGTGGFAKCFQVISQGNGQIYAAKVIPKKSINQKRQRYKLLVEIKIHRSLKHKHIVQFIQTFEDRQNVYILLQYCQNYTLKDLVKRRKRITEYETKIYIQQIVKAIIYIHSHSIIHRDLKLGNILINQHMDTKICDFGLSTRVKHQGQAKKTICGTPNYIAPEILEENGHSYQVDIWSIGVIMYTLLFGKPPFEDHTVQQTYQNIKNNKFSYPPAIVISNSAKDLINRILVNNPSKRISLQQILQHDFMKYKQQMPKQLPTYTIAIPPFKIMEIQSRMLSVHEMGMENSNSGEIGGSMEKEKGKKKSQKEKEGKDAKDRKEVKDVKDGEGGIPTAYFPLVYVKQCFFYEDVLGYLLSNGFIGIFYKNTGMNVVLQYGSTNYYIYSKNNQYQPIKKSLPSDQFQINHNTQSQYLEQLLNFRTFFVTKYGIFKLDQIRKKYLILLSQSESKSRVQQLEDFAFIKKAIKMNKGEIVTRMSNQIIQVHFNDLTSLMINHEENGEIYYMDEKGKVKEMNYQRCGDAKLKTKMRMFSNLLERLASLSRGHQDKSKSGQRL